MTLDFQKVPGNTYYQVCSHDYGTSYRTIIAQVWSFDGTSWISTMDTQAVPIAVRQEMGKLFQNHNPIAWNGSPPGFRAYFGS